MVLILVLFVVNMYIKIYKDLHVLNDNTISVFQESKINLSLFGYDLFCCPRCRNNRNSTVINDQYLG